MIVSNTAHLAVEQGRFADRVIQVEKPADVPDFLGGLPDGVTLITGATDARGRTQGLEGEALERVRKLAQQFERAAAARNGWISRVGAQSARGLGTARSRFCRSRDRVRRNDGDWKTTERRLGLPS